ncbi:DUF1963 domain-containing protein [Streptomyces griseofuscus]|uniref:DUF1963 domain-containing protein n=1 Tax=Streptomyces griseofuscus TaxID=146922 RepID=UPI00367E2A7B
MTVDLRPDADERTGADPRLPPGPEQRSHRRPGRWVLLAQIGGGLVEGDPGRVYWVIRHGDLANGHFDQAWACYDMVG